MVRFLETNPPSLLSYGGQAEVTYIPPHTSMFTPELPMGWTMDFSAPSAATNKRMWMQSVFDRVEYTTLSQNGKKVVRDYMKVRAGQSRLAVKRAAMAQYSALTFYELPFRIKSLSFALVFSLFFAVQVAPLPEFQDAMSKAADIVKNNVHMIHADISSVPAPAMEADPTSLSAVLFH